MKRSMTFKFDSAVLEDFKAFGKEILEQDGEMTANPVFLIQQKRRFIGVDPDYTEDIAWLYDSEEVSAMSDDPDFKGANQLEDEYQESGDIPEGYIRTGYVDNWETVTFCLTRLSAEKYISDQRHNLKEPRIYVDTLNRNPEMIAIRLFIQMLAEGYRF